MGVSGNDLTAVLTAFILICIVASGVDCAITAIFDTITSMYEQQQHVYIFMAGLKTGPASQNFGRGILKTLQQIIRIIIFDRLFRLHRESKKRATRYSHTTSSDKS